MVRAWQDVAARYTDDELRLILDFYGQMEQIFREHLTRLRDAPPPAGASTPEPGGAAD
jgi:hypothetical protein